MVERDSLTPQAAGFLWAMMQTTTSVVVSGHPGAGKTSLLAALISAVPSNHCVRCCEEIRELYVPITHGAYYEARPPAVDGSGEISLRMLVEFVLAKFEFFYHNLALARVTAKCVQAGRSQALLMAIGPRETAVDTVRVQGVVATASANLCDGVMKSEGLAWSSVELGGDLVELVLASALRPTAGPHRPAHRRRPSATTSTA